MDEETQKRIEAIEWAVASLSRNLQTIALVVSDGAAITNRDLNEIRAKVGMPEQKNESDL